jgi:hypothetical protein
MVGGSAFSRGHLYRILSNPLYAGRISHKEKTYQGQHPAVIDQATWDAVQRTLAENSHARLVKAHSKNPSLLAGLSYDEHGEKLIATHANKRGRRYRYYVSAAASRPGPGRSGTENPERTSPFKSAWRLPAHEIEAAVIRIIAGTLTDECWVLEHAFTISGNLTDRQRVLERASFVAAQLQDRDAVEKRGLFLALVSRVIFHEGRIELELTLKAALWTGLGWMSSHRGTIASDGYSPDCEAAEQSEGATSASKAIVRITRPLAIRRRGTEMRLVIEGVKQPHAEPDPALIKALAQAHRWWRDLMNSASPRSGKSPLHTAPMSATRPGSSPGLPLARPHAQYFGRKTAPGIDLASCAEDAGVPDDVARAAHSVGPTAP